MEKIALNLIPRTAKKCIFKPLGYEIRGFLSGHMLTYPFMDNLLKTNLFVGRILIGIAVLTHFCPISLLISIIKCGIVTWVLVEKNVCHVFKTRIPLRITTAPFSQNSCSVLNPLN